MFQAEDGIRELVRARGLGDVYKRQVAILGASEGLLAGPDGRPLAGHRAVVTAGPTFEPIDPVRGLTNRSSGKQGYAIAGALARVGAQVVPGAGAWAVPFTPLQLPTRHLE